jgi:hypothetical protein
VVVDEASSARHEQVELLVEAERFDDFGGWLLDSQFVDQMGSPYLLAHGLGKPVADARTSVHIRRDGEYRFWVRAKDWVPSHHPGRFRLIVDGTALGTELGANGRDWGWEYGGAVRLDRGDVTLELCDLTGFEGRCDAIFLTTGDTVPPEHGDEGASQWRTRLLGIPDEPENAGEFDLVVVGGGVGGCAAALSAARLGSTVALIQNRPCLGGNASAEIGLGPRGEKGPLIEELTSRDDNGELEALEVLEAEATVSVFLEHQLCDAIMDGSQIVAIDARDLATGASRRFRARVFVDCSGNASLGLLAGAETRFGREARSDFDESLAPETADEMHHGNTVLFRTRMASGPESFPAVPWAREVAGDFADLGGQLERPGRDNRPGPRVGPKKARMAVNPDGTFDNAMSFPASHFWEYGQFLDPYAEGEHIRDHLLCAIYGTFANVKQQAPEKYANLVLDWVGHVPAGGEYRRLVGDYTLTENDIRAHRDFPDAVVKNRDPFCLHYPGHESHDFRLGDWKWIPHGDKPYSIPFRCLYSVNISNLMMAGKHISVTHVAGSSTKMIGNGGQHGIAVGAAAYLCAKHGSVPREIGRQHIQELQKLTNAVQSAQHGGEGAPEAAASRSPIGSD